MSRNRSIIAVIAVILLVGGSVLAVSMTGANNVAKHLEFGNGHLQEGNYEEAIRAFEKAIRIDPENIGAGMALASFHYDWRYRESGNVPERSPGT